MVDRNALRRQIFATCRSVGLKEEDRHALQKRVVGKASLSNMDEAEMQRVVAALQGAKTAPAKGHKYPRAPRSDLRLIHVLWRLLGEAGELNDPTRNGLNKFIRSRFEKTWYGVIPADVDMLREHACINDVITALKDWCARSGIEIK